MPLPQRFRLHQRAAAYEGMRMSQDTVACSSGNADASDELILLTLEEPFSANFLQASMFFSLTHGFKLPESIFLKQ